MSTTVITFVALVALFCMLGGSAIYVDRLLRGQLHDQTLVRSAESARADTLTFLLDEETGVRGFGATRQRLFLEPYLRAQPLYAQRFEALDLDLAALDVPDRKTIVADMRSTYYAWSNSVAAPLVDGSPDRPSADELERLGKALIDHYRIDTATLRRDLDALAAATDAASIGAIRTIFAINTIALIVVGAFVIFANARQRRLGQLLADRKRILDIETIARTMPQIVWTATPDARLDWFNASFTEYTGLALASDEKDFRTFIHPDDLDAAVAAWEPSFASGSPFEHRFRVRRADGEYRWFDNRAHPIRDSGGRIVKWYGTSTDVHETIVALEAEKHVANMLQRAFIQKELPTTPNLGVRATYIPAQNASQVGGDWYDAFVLPDKRVFFSIGDVTGHGLEAAVSMNRARQFIIAASLQNDDPASILESANRAAVMQNMPVVTAIVGFVDPVARAIRYATAGHPPPVLAAPNAPAYFLPYGGIPLGILENVARIPYRNHTATAAPGSVLVLYTDGVIEHGRDVLHGEAALLRAAATMASTDAENPAGGIHRMIFADALGEDDVAILTFRFERERSATADHDTLGALRSSGFGPTQTSLEISASPAHTPSEDPPPRPDASADRPIRRPRTSR